MTSLKGWTIGTGEATGEIFLTCPKCRKESMMSVADDRLVSELVKRVDWHNRSCPKREV